MLRVCRLFLAVVACSFSFLVAEDVRAQKPIKIVVGFAPGGALDAAARVIAEQVSRDTGNPVMVENKPGASTTIALEFVKNSAPDGSTILLTPSSVLTLLPYTTKNIRYDAEKDLVPVAIVTDFPSVVFTAPDSPFSNMTEYFSWIKSDPKNLNGVGLVSLRGAFELALQSLSKESGVPMIPVSYRGAAPLTVDVMAGNTPIGVDALGSVLPLYREGKVKFLGLSGTERTRFAPEVPTVLEQGFKGMERGRTWYAMYAPSKTPNDILARREAEFMAAANNPEVIKKMERLGMEMKGQSGKVALDRLTQERVYWKTRVDAAGWSPE